MIKESAPTQFLKSQLSAFVGGIIDIGTLIFCTEILGIHYTLSLIIGGIIGAGINFSINRYWTFDSRTAPKITQLQKFIVVVFGSITLKLAGTILFTEIGHIDYRLSRIMTDIVVCFGFNFTLQKFWVFK